MVINVVKTYCCWYSLQHVVLTDYLLVLLKYLFFPWVSVHLKQSTTNIQSVLLGFVTSVQCFTNFAVRKRKTKKSNSKCSSTIMSTVKVRIHQIMPNTHFVTYAGISPAHHHQNSEYSFIWFCVFMTMLVPTFRWRLKSWHSVPWEPQISPSPKFNKL